MNIVDRIISPNIWDEKYISGGGLNYSTGEVIVNQDYPQISSDDFIEVEPNTTYVFTCLSEAYFRAVGYNSNKQFEAGIFNNIKPNNYYSFTTPNNVKYIKFASIYATPTYGNTYKHDICINESNPSINGKYFPYIMYKRYDMVDRTHNLWNKTVKYNQLTKSINASNWYASGGATTYSDGVGTFTASVQTGSAYTSVALTENHKYLILATIKLTTESNQIVFRHQNNSLYSSVTSINTTEWQILSKIFTATNNASEVFQILDNRSSGRDAIKFKDVYCIDLTEWFGSNDSIPQSLLDDPSTFNEYWDGSLDYNNTGILIPPFKRLKIGG